MFIVLAQSNNSPQRDMSPSYKIHYPGVNHSLFLLLISNQDLNLDGEYTNNYTIEYIICNFQSMAMK